ncbi:MAG: hypothetical protein COT17_08240 [Elusimicrobia bacterium CG08_land_8_20_14_0_20_51_18]|nr:MAG: hypothetical protein COT17_08240 [Elusimicrobia bacterium CG08_land_8_20_14_0_20_51_18]
MDETGFEYRAVWDKRTAIITWLTALFLLYVVGHAAWIIAHSNMNSRSGYALGTIVFFTLFLTYIYSPRGYAITATHLVIRRAWKPVLLELAEIEKAEALSGEMLAYSFRLWGSGGLFGFFGLFINRKLGRYTAYYTDFSKLVLVKAGKTYVISPSDTREFLAALSERIKQ